MRRIAVFGMLIAAMLVPGTALAKSDNGAGGVTGPAFYVDGELYRTVGTPTDLSGTGGPLHSFDVIYAIAEQGPNVATAAPGDHDYNGGRWMVHALSFSDYAKAVEEFDFDNTGDLSSAAEVHAALNAGYAEDTGIAKSFECPVIPLPKGHHS